MRVLRSGFAANPLVELARGPGAVGRRRSPWIGLSPLVAAASPSTSQLRSGNVCDSLGHIVHASADSRTWNAQALVVPATATRTQHIVRGLPPGLVHTVPDSLAGCPRRLRPSRPSGLQPSLREPGPIAPYEGHRVTRLTSHALSTCRIVSRTRILHRLPNPGTTRRCLLK